MELTKNARFFLGANSSEGFYSLFCCLPEPRNCKSFIILKGGPGCGKSTFMKNVAILEGQQGGAVEYIHCSSDSRSLDAVILPRLKAVIVDGTAPHAADIKPTIEGAKQHSCRNRGD